LLTGACCADVPQAGPNFVVTTTADHDDGICNSEDCTLREAINAANAHSGEDAIIFKTGVRGTITLQATGQLGTLVVTNPVTITGPGARYLAISGNDAIRIFSFRNGPSLLSGLTIRNGVTIRDTIGPGGGGDVGGGGIFNSSALTVSDCIISGNTSKGGSFTVPGGPGESGDGGGICNTGVLTLERCSISNNTATGSQGGDLFPVEFGSFSYGGTGGAARGGGVFNDSTGTLTIGLSPNKILNLRENVLVC
jgi:CSLREA domain-containing protein